MSGPGGASPRREEHEVFDELAVGWALHALEPEEETLLAAHLPECARCRRTVAETTEVMGAMAAGLPPAEPSDRLRNRLRAAVEDTEQVSPPTTAPAPEVAPAADPDHRPPAPSTPWRRVLPNALIAAAVATILGLGTWNVVLSSARDEARTALAEQAEMVNALLTPGRAAITPLSADDGAPVATVVARDSQVQVVTHGLGVNDERAQTYVVWGTAEGPPVPLGTFDVDSPQMDLQTVGSASTGLDEYSGYAISLERRRQAPGDLRKHYAEDGHRSLRERVAETRWRRRLAARRPVDRAYRMGVGIVGAVVVAVGLATIPLPGPGWLTVIAGLFVLASEFFWAERLLEFTKKHVKAWTDWLGRQRVWVRALIAAATAAFVYGVLVVVLHVMGVPDWVPGWVPLWR